MRMIMGRIRRLAALWQNSLRLRLLAVVLSVMLIGIWSLSLYVGSKLRSEIREAIGQQQFALSAEIANDINEALLLRQQALEVVAASLVPMMTGPADQLQQALEDRPVTRLLFNAGFLVFNGNGTAIADVPRETGRIGLDYKEDSVLIEVLKDGRSSISEPMPGKVLKVPVFTMVVPIRDANGRIVGALAGVTNLTRPNFLGSLNRRHHVEGGRHMLVAPRHRLVVASSDPEFVMTQLPLPGESPLVDRFVAGFEGTGIATNRRGEEVLASVKRIPITGWYVASAVPTEIAFVVAEAIRRQILLAAVILSLAAGGLVWWLLSRQLAPLAETVRALELRSHGPKIPLPMPTQGDDEVGQVITAFNRLLAELVARQVSLRESEESYRNFFESSPEAITVMRDDRIVFANQAALSLLGRNEAKDLVGGDWHELIDPRDWPRNTELLARVLSGELKQVPPLERKFRLHDGRVLDLELVSSRVSFGGKIALLTVIRDVSERRRTEQDRLAEVDRQRDTLVREVHHRIKNNLQSVAGLLQRELGASPELDSSLQVAISQVNSIAVVHGLQSKHTGESIRLCDCLENICRVASDLTRRAVDFSIDDAADGFRPAWVDREEAVSVALVLNELVLNAIKHSAPSEGLPAVALRSDGRRAQVDIRNSTSSPPQFNFDRGTGLGMGLQLVRSLLPDRGVHLAYEIEQGGGVVRTQVTFESPVLVHEPVVAVSEA